MSHTTESIRNIVLAGHSASGKTTLIESILYHAGKIHAPGAVEKGNTVCDFNPQEKVHQHSLDAALAKLDYNGMHINLIDTPGFPDFIGQAIAVLPAVENGSRGHQRPNRYRSDHTADDGTRRRAWAMPDDHCQQDRCREH